MTAPTRMTRAERQLETRRRLLDAAEALFAEKGINGTSIEEITERAGFSRGAFYSNFADRDALVVALLESTKARDDAEIDELWARSADAAAFFEGLRLRVVDQTRQALSMEFVLYAIRNPGSRPQVAAILRASRQARVRVVEGLWESRDIDGTLDAATATKIVEALDDGLGMRHMIDPEEFPLGMFTDVVGTLLDAIEALSKAEPPSEKAEPLS